MSESDELAKKKERLRRAQAELTQVKVQLRRFPLNVRVIATVWGLFKLSNWRIRWRQFRLWLVIRGCDVQMATIYLRQCRARLLLRIADALEGMLDRISRGS